MPAALEDVVRIGVAADRAGVAMHLLHAVRGPLAVEVVPLHHAGGAAALAGADHVDGLDFGEDVDLEFLADLPARRPSRGTRERIAAARSRPWAAASTPAAARVFGRLLSSLAT